MISVILGASVGVTAELRPEELTAGQGVWRESQAEGTA